MSTVCVVNATTKRILGMGVVLSSGEVEARIARLAARQHAAAARRQLIELGLTRRVIDRRLERGQNAFLSHASAASLWQLLPTGQATADRAHRLRA